MRFFSRLRGNKVARATVDIAPTPAGEGFVVIDVETTGLSPADSRIIELAVVRTDCRGRIVSEWVSRFNPQGSVGATHIHGITERDVRNAPLFGEMLPEIVAQMRGAAAAAHNAPFDMSFMRGEFIRAGWEMPTVPTLCTLQASRTYLPGLGRRRLADCCAAAGVKQTGAHSALGDARATAALLAFYLDPAYTPEPLADHLALPSLAADTRWPDGPTTEPRLPVPRGLTPREKRPAVRPVKIQPTLRMLVAEYSLEDALDEGAPEGSVAYLELLLQALEDSELSDGEFEALADTAQIAGMTIDDVEAANTAFIGVLAQKAIEDGAVSRAERQELVTICDLLGIPAGMVKQALQAAHTAALQAASEGLGPLPRDWSLGEPLRVGDRVAFTGCDRDLRDSLEKRATGAGVKIANGVTRGTAMLVTDFMCRGSKFEEALARGIRMVHPDDFSVLLEHLQPAIPQEASAFASPATVRAWARANGFDIAPRGRIPADAYAAYRAATPQG